ncbi:hypothetical protein D3C81_2109810 [compost metagenome]
MARRFAVAHAVLACAVSGSQVLESRTPSLPVTLFTAGSFTELTASWLSEYLMR